MIRFKILFALLFCVLVYQWSYAQKSKPDQFEKIKGKLPFPVCRIYGYSDVKCTKTVYINNPQKNITFITDSAAEVRAIYNGQVCGVFNIEKEWAVVTKFDNLYITYYPLTKTKLKKGNTVCQGQPIAKISSLDNPNEINILISKESKFVDPYKWFKW